jgi:hypothetical protein
VLLCTRSCTSVLDPASCPPDNDLHSINGHTVLTAIRQTGACFTTHLRGVDDGVDGIFVHKV